MKKYLLTIIALFSWQSAKAEVEYQARWTRETIQQLQNWILAAPSEGLCMSANPSFSQALARQDTALLHSAATVEALKLARLHLLGCATPLQKRGWNIASSDEQIDIEAMLVAALLRGDLNGFYETLRPQTRDYVAIRAAYRTQSNPALRATLARNMERWRWMPLDLGKRYLIVNVPSFEVSLYEDKAKLETWRVIVGKPATPTPVFSATVTGVTINPWWNVPQSIVNESVGSLTRSNPAEARRRGFVWGDGVFRQRPGPNNALGQMKLAMANPYSVYLHDTPNKALFRQTTRAYSHGCIRVGSALSFASRLLGQTVDASAASGRTQTLSLADPIPVYVTYFTADSRNDGQVRFHADIYRRDASLGDSLNPSFHCDA